MPEKKNPEEKPSFSIISQETPGLSFSYLLLYLVLTKYNRKFFLLINGTTSG